ncbi:MAG: efflux RND transporter periplasmic adaptor subunit, partial [Ignavibacteriaceae bacterium]
MKKLKYFIVLFLVVGGIIAILLNNKSKLQAKSKNEKIEAYPVKVVPVERKNTEKSLELVGTIEANNDVAIISEAQGKVVGVYAKVGDYKTKGSTIIQLDNELKLAAFKTAEVNYEKAKKDFERYEALYQQKSVTDAQRENIKLALQSAEAQYIVAKREYNDTKITTPISGVITSRIVDVGNYVQKASPVANVVDIAKLKVKLNVSEKDAFQLKEGDKVEVKTDVYQGLTFNGKIETISDKGDEAHTYPVEISIPNNKEHPLKAGMFGTVSFSSKSNSPKLLIPRDALLGSIKDPQVYVVQNGIANIKKRVN